MTVSDKTTAMASLKKWARAHRSLAMTVATAQAFAEMERERVDAYVLPIFLRYAFTEDLTFKSPGSTPGRVLTDPKQLYLSTDEARCAAYFAECDAAHREHGYRGEPGTCPALVAEDLLIKAQNLLLDALAVHMGQTHNDDGKSHAFYSLDLRAKALNLAMSIALGAK